MTFRELGAQEPRYSNTQRCLIFISCRVPKILLLHMISMKERMNGSMNGEILDKHLLPSLRMKCWWILKQDEEPKHITVATKERNGKSISIAWKNGKWGCLHNQWKTKRFLPHCRNCWSFSLLFLLPITIKQTETLAEETFNRLPSMIPSMSVGMKKAAGTRPINQHVKNSKTVCTNELWD